VLRTPQTLIISLYAFGGFFPLANRRYVDHPRPIPGTASKSALRCEKIREYADTILQGDDEILLYVPGPDPAEREKDYRTRGIPRKMGRAPKATWDAQVG
jgi:hypothetical protein